MVNPDTLFNRAALDKMRSPERLDTLLHITNPIGWMALIAVMLLLGGVVLWSIFGAFSVKAEGTGLIMDAGGVRRFVAGAPGRVDALYITKGQRVEKGQIIGHVAQPGSSAEVDTMRNSVSLGSNQVDVAQRVNQYDAKKNVTELVENLVCPYDGIVDEITTTVGTFINTGEDICIIRRNEGRSDLTGVIYVPASKGKRIERDMSIQLAPSNSDTSHSGSLLGIVRSVSQYPVTQSEMLHRLGNAQLVQMILQQGQGAVVAVTFDLVRNPEDESGYLWTSVVGKHRPVTAGTFVSGSVIVDRKPPIAKVFYKASQWLRSR